MRWKEYCVRIHADNVVGLMLENIEKWEHVGGYVRKLMIENKKDERIRAETDESK